MAPPGAVVLGAGVLGDLVAQGASLFVVGLRMAAPVLVVLLVVNAGLGVLARTIPQLNVLAVGAPVQVGVGLVVLGTSLPFTARLLAGRFGDLGGVLDALVRSLGALAHG
jgi:flagellar biosynthetic protein FliR